MAARACERDAGFDEDDVVADRAQMLGQTRAKAGWIAKTSQRFVVRIPVDSASLRRQAGR